MTMGVKITVVFDKVYRTTTTIEPPLDHPHAEWALKHARTECISFGALSCTLELDGCKWEWKRPKEPPQVTIQRQLSSDHGTWRIT